MIWLDASVCGVSGKDLVGSVCRVSGKDLVGHKCVWS